MPLVQLPYIIEYWNQFQKKRLRHLFDFEFMLYSFSPLLFPDTESTGSMALFIFYDSDIVRVVLFGQSYIGHCSNVL